MEKSAILNRSNVMGDGTRGEKMDEADRSSGLYLICMGNAEFRDYVLVSILGAWDSEIQ